MAARNTVSVRIALEGGDTVKSQLRELGTAFDQIGTATGRLISSFQRFGSASQSFNNAINRVVSQTARIGIAVAGAVTSVGLLAKSSADSATGVEALANQLGLTTTRVQQLQGAFAKQGVGPDQLTQALTGVQESFRSLRDEFATPLPGQARAVEQFKELGVTVTRAGEALKTVGFDQFGRKLADGVKPAVQTFDEFGVTVRRFGDAYKNTANAVASNPLAKLSGLTGIDLTKAIGESPEKQLFRVFDALAKVQDQAERVNIAKGLGIGPELLTVIKGGTTEIQAFADRLKVTFDPKTIADSQKLAAAFVNLRFVATQTKNAMGAVFSEGGAGSNAIEQFTQTIEDSRGGLVQFARDVRNVVMPEVQNFIRLLAGQDVPKDSIFAGLKIDVPAAALAIKGAIQSVIIPAFQALYSAAETASAIIKEFTGTEISASALLIGVAFLQLTGAFRLLGTAVGLVGAAVGLLLSPFRFLATLLLTVANVIRAGILLPFAAVGAVFGSAAASVLLFAARVGGLIALGSLLITNWQAIKTFFGTLFDGIGQLWQGQFSKGFQTILQAATAAFEGLKNASTSTWIQIAAAALLAFGGIIPALRIVMSSALLVLTAGGAFITSFFGTLFAGLVPVAAAAGAAIGTAIRTGIAGAIALIPALLAGWPILLAAALGAAIVIFWDDIVKLGNQAFEKIKGFAQSLGTSIADSIKSAIDGAITYIGGKLDALVQKIKSVTGVFSNPGSLPNLGSPNELGGFARGGAVWGRGTGRSDSILARLSNGEFVIRADVVSKLGLPLLNALNSGRLNLRGLLPGFATGGLVNASMPRFATGGAVSVPSLSSGSSLAPVNLHIGGSVFEGLMAPEDVIKQISRAASTGRLVSAGRKPSWQGAF